MPDSGDWCRCLRIPRTPSHHGDILLRSPTVSARTARVVKVDSTIDLEARKARLSGGRQRPPAARHEGRGNAETIPWRRFRSGPVHHRRRGQKVPRRARFVRIVVRYLECREMAHSGKERPSTPNESKRFRPTPSGSHCLLLVDSSSLLARGGGCLPVLPCRGPDRAPVLGQVG